MVMVLDGKAVAAFHREKISRKVAELKEQGIVPKLAIVLAGDDQPSALYARSMQKVGRAAGIEADIYSKPADVTESELLDLVDSLNDNPEVKGILLMMPLPGHIDAGLIISHIAPEKDVDGLTAGNSASLFLGRPGMIPCTPKAVMAALDYYHISLEGKQVVIVGRSNVVGKPLALLCLQRNATVTMCHSRTSNLSYVTQQADVLISAAGRAKLIKGEMVGEGAVVIDVGINYVGGKPVGDVEYDAAAARAGAITPVPGGIGSITTTMVIENVVFGINASD